MKKSACDNNTVPGSTDYATKAIERALPCKTYNTLNAHEKEIINNRHFDHNRQGPAVEGDDHNRKCTVRQLRRRGQIHDRQSATMMKTPRADLGTAGFLRGGCDAC
jgi:hypothetical protein